MATIGSPLMYELWIVKVEKKKKKSEIEEIRSKKINNKEAK